MNKTQRLYDNMFPADLRNLDAMREGFCSNCSEKKFVHNGCEFTPTCIFCEDECAGCGESIL